MKITTHFIFLTSVRKLNYIKTADSDKDLSLWEQFSTALFPVFISLENNMSEFLTDKETKNLVNFFNEFFSNKYKEMLELYWKTVGNTVILVDLVNGDVSIHPFDQTPSIESENSSSCDDIDDEDEEEDLPLSEAIDKVIFNNNHTIVKFVDGSKSIAKCDTQDEFNPVAGFAIALCKAIFGNREFHGMAEKYCYPEYVKREESKSKE